MTYWKMKKAVLCTVFVFCCCFLWGCSLSFCGLTIGGKDELVFTCEEEVLAEPARENGKNQGTEQDILSEPEDQGTEQDVPSEPEDPTGDGAADGRVNLNTAGMEELMTITGIGETRAKAILEYRSQNGQFTEPEDIMQVPGIKEGIFSKIKDQITVQ